MRRKEFEVKDKDIIKDILNSSDYGTFALAVENKPYSIPVNFVYENDIIYFHGAKKGKKRDYILENSLASFSVAQPYSLIQSYFGDKEALACAATHFFKSVCCDGKITIVENYEEKVKALALIMKKFQPEGQYKPLADEIYRKMINATEVFRFDIEEIVAKIKVGQNLSEEKFNSVIESLENRGTPTDKLTIKFMKEFR